MGAQARQAAPVSTPPAWLAAGHCSLLTQHVPGQAPPPPLPSLAQLPPPAPAAMLSLIYGPGLRLDTASAWVRP
jgi:hypothetical protein